MSANPPRSRVLTAFAALYIVWGSTYLAIRIAIETLPPFLMAGVRFLIAGVLLYGWMRVVRKAERPSRQEWRAAAVIGTLLLMGGNGAVVWAEQLVPSGVAALLVAITPVLMVLLNWLWHGAARPGARTVVGLVLGFAGLALLIGPDAIAGGGVVHPVGAAVLMIGCISWAIGSIYSKGVAHRSPPLLATGMQMLIGGSVLVLAGLVTGELGRLDLDAVSLRSLLAMLYLILVGAIVGFSAYIWLLRVVSPARVSTYAYVNPIVAVILGWALAGEPFSTRMAIAALIIISGVVLVTLGENASDRETGSPVERSAARVAA